MLKDIKMKVEIMKCGALHGKIFETDTMCGDGSIWITYDEDRRNIQPKDYRILSCNIPLPLPYVLMVIKEGDIWAGMCETIEGIECGRFKINWGKGPKDVMNPTFEYRLLNIVSFGEAMGAFYEGKKIKSLVTEELYLLENLEIVSFSKEEILGGWVINEQL